MSFAVSELEGFTLLHVATRGDASAAATRLAAVLGIPVTANPGDVSARDDDVAVLWAGPGRWFVHARTTGFRMNPVDGCAITDLSDSRRHYRLSGPDAVPFLSAACPLDLRAKAMPPGTCALSHFDRFPILLCRRAASEFDLLVERSYVPALGLPDA